MTVFSAGTPQTGHMNARTFLDMSRFRKARDCAWVNEHDLGRYWNIGPQKRRDRPAPGRQHGENAIMVLDLHETELQPTHGNPTRTIWKPAEFACSTICDRE